MGSNECRKVWGLLALRARPCEGLFSWPSVNRFMQMVSPLFSGCPISVVTACRKNPFPSPTPFLHWDIALAGGKPKCAYASKRLCENRLRRARKSRESCKRQVAMFSGLVGAGSTDLERGAAVDEELHAGNEIRFVGYEKQRRLGHLPGRAHLAP